MLFIAYSLHDLPSTNFMEQKPSWEPNSRLAGQEFEAVKLWYISFRKSDA